jgi:alkylation response protein AidB-like acyl-CoA dehydrogenase
MYERAERGAFDMTAPPARDRAALLSRVPPLAEEIAKGASRRDQTRELPFAAFRLFRESGLGALRVPSQWGGPGGSVADLIEMISTLAAADPNVAHALRTHFNFTETQILSPPTPRTREAIETILAGKIFGGAHTELDTKRPGTVTTTLTPDGAKFRLNGRKGYATGTAFADHGLFTANDATGAMVIVQVPLDRPGIVILDDWDGMGQRLTASGGVRFDNVEVGPGDIAPRVHDARVGRHASTLRQLHLAACAAGIARNVVSDAIAYTRDHSRSPAHSPAETAREDPFVQQVIGEISARSFAIDAVIGEAARALDRAAAAFATGDAAAIEAALIASALSAARAQLVGGRLALEAAERMFETGGGSATSTRYNFDRHWRNIRTLLNHNPLLHKARVVGDYLLNGTTTYLEEGKVF